jgi:hypothetical protein
MASHGSRRVVIYVGGGRGLRASGRVFIRCASCVLRVLRGKPMGRSMRPQRAYQALKLMSAQPRAR